MQVPRHEEASVRPFVALEAHRQEVRDIASAHRASNPRVLSSTARSDDTSEGDLDLLIDPTADATLLDAGAIPHERLVPLGMTVDVLTPKAPRSRFRCSVFGGRWSVVGGRWSVVGGR